jgi:3-hydroxyisobutyrate dehydrogenase
LSVAQRTSAAASQVEIVKDAAAVFAETSLVVFSLPTARDVEAVVKASGGLLDQSRTEKTIIIDTSTSEPDVSRKLASDLKAAGHGFLDAPVSGGLQGASSGNLTMMIGGAEEDVALARPVIEADGLQDPPRRPERCWQRR